MATFFSDWFYLSIRQIKQIWRPLLSLIPPLFIPAFFFLVNSFAFKSVSLIPGFPADSYLKFQAPVAIFMAIFFSAGNAGIELVMDIAGGYFKKLLIAPISRLAIILSRLTSVGVQAIIQGLIVLVLVEAIGVRSATGWSGLALMFAILVVFAMAWSSIGISLALRTQNARLVQSLFVLFFPLLYLTTAQMPRDLLPESYARLVALNPVTYILEAIRTLMIVGWDWPVINRGIIVVIGLFIVLVSFAVSSFRQVTK